ncbi:MAG: TonB-dependent receptor plug domain-containing protein, partial [Pseudomonadota bacterium]
MDFIRSRKHAKPAQSLGSQSLFAFAVLASPLAGQAQTASQADQTLPEIRVKSKKEVPYKADVLSSPKATQPILDTPQVISVIKKEVLQEQGATSLAEALRNTPGITVQLGENGNTSAGDTFQLRGFAAQSSVFVDGVRDLGAVTRDTYNFDQIEVVKGPSGSDIGRGAGAGYINLVTKLPSLGDANSAEASWYSGNTKRLVGDFNKKLGETS